MGFPVFSLDDYEITRKGEVINKKWGNRKLKPQPNGKGYLRVHIAGRMYFVHRLVAEIYVPNPQNKPQVNHKDGDKTNNNADNLEWVTNQENRDHAMKNGLHFKGEKCSWSKLTQKAVEYIRSHTDCSKNDLAELFGVSPSTIVDVWEHRSWKDS